MRPPRRPYWLHGLLFLATCLTCTIVGVHLQSSFAAGVSGFIADGSFFPWRAILHPRLLVSGVPFAASLLAILFAHEMGHFLLAVRNRVYATLPFFIPAPTPIGTFGAFIQIRSRFHTANELLDIAIGGPIAGFVVAVPLTLLGLALSVPAATVAAEPNLGFPLIFDLCHLLLGRSDLNATLLHPIAIAAWVGMLATALNLLPGGQLDGGHILYAISPSLHRHMTWLFAGALFVAAIFFWSGWMIWAVAFLITRRHPPVLYPEIPLDPLRRTLAWIALLLFILTVIPVPFTGGGFLDAFGELLH